MKIEKFHINNFRSLNNFIIEDFDSTTIFYGENNTGKSNILKALECIFKRKVQYDDNEFTSPRNFYEGVIKEFSNNFFNDDKSLTISFSVDISISLSETVVKERIKNLFKKWPDILRFSIEGKIINSSHGDDFAEMQTNKIQVNGITIYSSDSNSFNYFETLQKDNRTNTSDLSEAFEYFIDPLNDCVFIIESARETHPTKFNDELLSDFKPDDFKRSLYSLYLDEKKHSVFEQINKFFNDFPFSFGTISFAHIKGNLEIMIMKDGIRLPIKHLGSGVEQVLFVITSLVYTKRRIVCIEELEQNLSPRLQNLALIKLQSMIGKFYDQIIISSHSSVFSKPKLSKAIYLIDKEGLNTVVIEKLEGKFGEKIKKHFIDAAPPPDTYTEEEFKMNIEEVRRLTEERFKM